jgi:hypothetical protein
MAEFHRASGWFFRSDRVALAIARSAAGEAARG